MGTMVYMLKPEARGAAPPHWICQNCLEQDFVSALQPTGKTTIGRRVYECPKCEAEILGYRVPTWAVSDEA
jgi:hypothetical protein